MSDPSKLWDVRFLYNGKRREIETHSPTERGALSAAVMKHPDVPGNDKRLTIHSNFRHNTWRATPQVSNVPHHSAQTELPDPRTHRNYADWPAMRPDGFTR